jgi:hypothetical protein
MNKQVLETFVKIATENGRLGERLGESEDKNYKLRTKAFELEEEKAKLQAKVLELERENFRLKHSTPSGGTGSGWDEYSKLVYNIKSGAAVVVNIKPYNGRQLDALFNKVDFNKVDFIKAIRAISADGLGLKEAKDLAECGGTAILKAGKFCMNQDGSIQFL